MNLPTTKKELEDVANQMSKKYEAFMNTYRKRKYELERGVETTLKTEFGAQLNIYSMNRMQIGTALQNMRQQAYLEESKKLLTFPEGTVFCKWEMPRYGGLKLQLVGKGVLQIFRNGDEYPDNQRWGIPSVGNIVIRWLKKDGSLGKQIDKIYGDPRTSDGWFKEGIDPNYKKQPLDFVV